jgi:hypothetical protein
MSDPAQPVPSSRGIIATMGTEPQNAFVKALIDAAGQLKTELGHANVRREIVAGVFLFLEKEFPAAAPLLSTAEPFVQSLAASGATP